MPFSRFRGGPAKVWGACILLALVFALLIAWGAQRPPPAAAVGGEGTDAAPVRHATVGAPRDVSLLEASLQASMEEFLGPTEKRQVLEWIRAGAPEPGFGTVQPILDTHCTGCHNADIMPRLSLTTYAEVARFAQVAERARGTTLLEDSLEGSMADYIEPADKAQVLRWLWAGAPAAGFAALEPIFREQCVFCHNMEDMPDMPLRTYAEVAPFLRPEGETPAGAGGSPLHPAVRLLDATGASVVRTGAPVSTIVTCGQCHDTQYIAGHSYHVTVGLEAYAEPGQVPRGRPWDTSPGLFGRWDPLTYRVLSPRGNEQLDIGTADWVRMFGARHVGGGPAALSREGHPLTELPVRAAPDPETYVLGEESGQPEPWDWQQSGIVEMNCFLCHIRQPNNAARLAALQAGRFRWAATATLEGTALVRRTPEGWEWNDSVFTAAGTVPRTLLGIGAPRSANCGICHGAVVEHLTPGTVRGALDQWRTETTGQIFSPERLAQSGLDTDSTDGGVSRPWDIHALRLLECVNCHYSLNNPAYTVPPAMPEHLRFDARRTGIGEYLRQPSHQFAKGRSPHGTRSGTLESSMRRCESCHPVATTHEWLPYKQRHLNAMTCEACHVPKLYAPARRQTDWTVLDPQGEPRVEYRSVGGGREPGVSALTGYIPVLLPREQADGTMRLTPHNLITSWYWVAGEPPWPVRVHDLRAALFAGEAYHPEILVALDTDRDGALQRAELVLDSPAKVEAVRRQLERVGVRAPRIRGEIQPFSLHHNVAAGPWATRDCGSCHGAASRVTRPLLLASYVPGDVMPQLVRDANVRLAGRLTRTRAGGLRYEPDSAAADLYVLGHDRWQAGDRAGMAAVIAVAIGVTVHTAFRLRFRRARLRARTPQARGVQS